MIKNKLILAVVPARGGSKGIKYKNLRKIKGKSLIEITGNFIRNLKFVDKAVVSTDHKLIAKKAKTLPVEIIIRQYITGSLWREYSSGINGQYGFMLDEGFQENQKL